MAGDERLMFGNGSGRQAIAVNGDYIFIRPEL